MKLAFLDKLLIITIAICLFFSGFAVGKMDEARKAPPPEPARFVYLETLSDEMQDGTMMYGICRYDRRRGSIETMTVFSLDAFRRVMRELEVTE